jgi:hypothetical protein
MSLKSRRNLPLVLLLLAILALLVLGLGEQPIIAYTAARDSLETTALGMTAGDVTGDSGATAGLLATPGTDARAP